MSKVCSLDVIYTNNERIKRNTDFYSTNFKNVTFFKRNQFVLNFLRIIKSNDYDRIILSGWDDIYYWISRLFLPKKKLRVVIESSVFEYNSNIFLDTLKRFFLNGIESAVVSGEPQEKLIRVLGFKGEIIKSYGVGILDFNYPRPSVQLKNNINTFLFIGRISKIKGLDLLFDFFKNNPHLFLHLVGEFEDQDYKIKLQGVPNIIYLGYKKREELSSIFSNADVLILPSLIEPWGLVVEEAIFHGLPSLVSSKVGCSIDLIMKFKLGTVFDPLNYLDFSSAMMEMTNINHFNHYQGNINNFDFLAKEAHYINSFLR
jgi:glycosyltransferase involved in cell wall biosynthesis